MSLDYLRQPLIQFAQSDPFVKGYIAAMLWAETHSTETEDSEDDGESFDTLGYTVGDFDTEALKEIICDCGAFERLALVPLYHCYADGSLQNAEYAGHNFYLTRNRHGAGFWDMGLPVLSSLDCGKVLTELSHTFGTQGLYAVDHTADERGTLHVHG